MAIVVEQERSSTNWLNVIGVLTVLFIIAGAIYYLFFAPVPFIETVLSDKLKGIEVLTGVQLNPEEVSNNPVYNRIIKSKDFPPETGSIGRENPFLPL